MAMNLGEASARITLDISDLLGKSQQAQSALSSIDGAVGRTSSGFSRFQNTLAKIGTAFIAPVIAGVKTAANIEQAMANVNASLGGLDTGALQELEQGFLDIGAASQFSAVDVAMVGDELAKAGFDPDRIIGVTQAVVDLSQATGEGLGPATTGMIQAMAMWSEEVVGTELAITDASRAADIFTIAANASAGGVGDIIGGLRNAGPALAGMQISFEDSAAAIALFTNYGYSGNEIGTKLTRTLTQLAKPTAEAAAEMEKYGIVAFDTEGKFIGFPALFDQLQTGFAGVGDEVKLAALKTIFGAEAFDLMNIAIATGGDPLRELEKLFDQTGVAAEQSALRMDTLRAQFGELVESVSNLLGRMMSGLLPVLRAVVDVANLVVNAISKIPQPILAAVGAVMALAAAFATLRGAAAGLSVISGLTGMTLPGTALFGGLGTALLAVAATAAVAYAAIKFNIGGIGDAVNKFISIWNNLADSAANNTISRFLIALGQALQTFDVAALDNIGRGLDVLGKGVNAFFDGFRGGGKDVESTTKKFEGFSELAEDGVTWKIKTEDGEEIGEIVDSVTDLETGVTTVKIRTEGGEEFETTIDMATGFVSQDYEVEVEVDAKDARNTVEKLIDGFDGMTESLEKSMFPALATVPRLMRDGLRAIDRLTEHFGYFRRMGLDPVNAALVSVGQVFPSLSDEMQTAQRIVNDFTYEWQRYRDAGVGPVGAALRALGDVITPLEGVMNGLADTTHNLGQAFEAAVQGDWAGVFEDVREAASDFWGVLREIGVAAGGLVVDLFNWTVNTGIPAITGWIADNAGDIGSAILAAAGWAWDNVIVPIGNITLQIAGWLVESADNAWEYVKNWVLGRAGGLQGAGGAAGGATARAAGGSIPIGPVLLVIQGWIVDAAQSAWDAIAQWVLGTGGGVSGAGRMTGGATASAAGTGIPIGTVAIQISEWDVVADAVDIYTAIYEWVDSSLAVSEADTARWEPIGQEIGANIMRSILTGVASAFTGGGGGGTGGGGGAAGGGAFGTVMGIVSGASVGDFLWSYLQPVVEGAWGELQPHLDNWVTQIKRDYRQWWNSVVPTIFQADVPGSELQLGGDNVFANVSDAAGGPTVFDALKEKIQSGWEEFTGWLDGFDFSVSMPDIDIDWGSFGAPIAEGWQNTMTLFDNIINWVKNPWKNVGSFDIEFPSIDIDWPDPPEVPEWLEQLLNDPVGWLKDKVGFGDSGGQSGGDPFNIRQRVDDAFETIRKVQDMARQLGVSASPSGGWGGPRTGPLPGLGILAGLIPSADVVGRAMSDAFAGVPAAVQTGVAAVQSTVSSIGAALGTLASRPITLTVTADTTQAITSLGEAAGAAAALNGTTSTVQVLGDNAGALAAIADSATALGGINGQSAMTFVNGDNSNALGAVLGAAAAIAGVDGASATTYIYAESFVQSAVDSARAALASIDGASATVSINTVGGGGLNIGQRLATGGYVRSQYQLVGERGPEVVSLPYGAYVHPHGTGPGMGGGGTTYVADFSGATFHNTSRAEMNQWAAEDFLPVWAEEQQRHETAVGVR